MQPIRRPPFSPFPAALWSAAFALDLASSLVGGNALVRASFAASALGCVIAIFALVRGEAGWNGFPRGHPLAALGRANATASISALALFCAALWLRSGALRAPRVPAPVLALGALALLLLAAGALLGRLSADARRANDLRVPLARDSGLRPSTGKERRRRSGSH